MEKLRQFNTSGYIWETNNISIEGGEVKEISLDNSKKYSLTNLIMRKICYDGK